jgi:hypothetical protein
MQVCCEIISNSESCLSCLLRVRSNFLSRSTIVVPNAIRKISVQQQAWCVRVSRRVYRSTASVRRTCQHTYATEASSQLILFPSIYGNRKRVMQIHQEGQGLQKRMLNVQQHRVLAIQRKLSLIAVRSLFALYTV